MPSATAAVWLTGTVRRDEVGCRLSNNNVEGFHMSTQKTQRTNGSWLVFATVIGAALGAVRGNLVWWLAGAIVLGLVAAIKAGGEVTHPPLQIPGHGTFAIYIHGGVHHGLWQL
jgi:hypothetical protein